jgi:hypothetical protein
MIDLTKVQETKFTYENIIKHVTEYDIYAYYLGNFEIGKVYNSPFRKDNKPSFGVYLGNNGVLMYNDYLLGSGNCISFTQRMENCSWFEAMCIINKRYNIGFPYTANKQSSYKHKPVITNIKITEKMEKWIDVKVKEWELHDKHYWQQYEISSSTLEFYCVYPIQKLWINNVQYKVDKHAYAYYFEPRVFKIYQPFSDTNKWLTNIKSPEIYQGSYQLPRKGDLLFITSSLKDVMVLHEAGFKAIAPHTEHQTLSEALYMHYAERFNSIVIFYDNDEAGIYHANKIVDKYDLKSLILPESDTKDPSDFVEKYDLSTLQNWILNSL